MARPKDPLSPYRVSVHKCNGHTYATTQPFVSDAEGKTVRRHYSWGILIGSKFIPNKNYIYASAEEREKLIFPKDWDLSAIENKAPASQDTFDLSSAAGYHDRFFGTTWLLGKIADRLRIKEDLLKTFHGDQELVNDILTVAMFPYVTTYNLSRLEKWQELEKYPSNRILSPPAVTRLTQSITEAHRIRFLRERARHLLDDELLAVDSTTKSGWGDTLINIRWGKNKERIPLEVTVEAVIYSLTTHQPVYYRVFPGNMNDSLTVRTILADLEEAGFHNVTLVTDRGYESIRNLEEYIIHGQKMIMCVKTGSGFALEAIRSLGRYSFVPEGFEPDYKKGHYYRQFDLSHAVQLPDGTFRESDRLKLNLYFDPVWRSAELKKTDIAQAGAKQELDQLIREKTPIENPESLRKKHPYMKLDFKVIPAGRWVEPHGKIIPVPEYQILNGYERDDDAIARVRETAGFFALITLGKDLDPVQALEHYKTRDEQEKYFSQMKTQMLCDRQRTSSEDGKAGRAFIQFIGLMLSSYLRHIWKTTELYELFGTSLEILDEMRSIRCIEYETRNMVKITPFTGRQLDVCRVFGFEFPEGSDMEDQKTPRKRGPGRPKGSKNKKKS